MKKGMLLLVAGFICCSLSAQLLVGASLGTYNSPNMNVRRLGPTVKIEYIYTDGASAFLEGSMYGKERSAGKETISRVNGAVIGEADVKSKYSTIHLQLGFKTFLGRWPDEEGLAFFLGAGGAFSSFKNVRKYSLEGYTIDDDKVTGTSYGFHFNSGFQYKFKKIIVDLKGNFDIMLKPVLTEGSHIILGSRLGVLIPLTKY
jgi:hypothetical protein